jgi:hypothetical protein
MDRHRTFGQVVEYRTKRVYNKGVLGDTGVKRSPWEYLTEYNILQLLGRRALYLAASFRAQGASLQVMMKSPKQLKWLV